MPQVTLTKDNSIIVDTYVAENSPGTTFGTTTVFQVGGDGNGKIYRALLKFDLGLIPNDAIINNATLVLTQQNGSGSRTLNIHKVTGAWDNSTTWATQPSFDPTVSASVVSTTSTPSIDVKNIVQEWVNGTAPNHGFLIKDSVEGVAGSERAFYSTEYGTAAQRPQLIIDYTIPSTGKKQVEVAAVSNPSASGTSSITVPVPAGAQIGDLLVAHVITGELGTINKPSGWTTQEHSTPNRKILIAYKYMQAGDTGATFSNSGTGVFWMGAMVAFRNVKNVLSYTNSIYTSNQTNYAPPAHTTTVDKTLFVLLNSGFASTSFTPPLGYSEKYDSSGSAGTLQLSYHYMHLDRDQAATEMTSTLSTSTTGVSSLLVLEPIVNNPPTLTLTSPTDNLTLSAGETLEVEGTASDPDGNSITVIALLNGNALGIVGTGTGTVNWQVSIPEPDMQLGDNTLVVTAIDSQGASTSKTFKLTKTDGDVPILVNDVRYKLPATDDVVAWVRREGGLTVDAALSGVAAGESEWYTPMEKTPTGADEDQFYLALPVKKDNITLRLTMTRQSVDQDVAITRLIGGIGK